MGLSCTKRRAERTSKGFFGNNLCIILAFLLPAAIMAAAFVVSRVFPFGNRMILVVDSWHQYYPFLEEYQRMLKEGSSFMYSWNIGGGANFQGLIANYVGSPLYLLSAFVPSGTPWLPAFLAGTVVLRVGIAGMSFAIFLRKVFGRNDLSLVTFSLMYALCAYITGYYWNMMWLDTVALMPLVVAGTISVLRDKKFALYIASLAISVICSFYIGFMVCVLVLIVSIGYTLISFVSFKESVKNAVRMLFYTGIAVMITAAVTVPAYRALGLSDSSGEIGGFPAKFSINYAYGYKEYTLVNTLLAIARTATNMLTLTKPIVYKEGLPNIACGVLALVLVFFYITSKKIKRKEKFVSLGICLFVLLSFVINQLNYIWHGFATPAMVYYRFSFVFSFVVIALAYRAFTLIDSVSKKNFFFASALIVLYLGGAFFLQRKISVAATFAGVAVILLGILIYRKKKLSKKTFSVLLCLFVVCEMGLNAYYSVRTVHTSSINNYPKNKTEVNELLAVSEAESADELVRTEFLTHQTLNDSAINGVYGISTFNSMVNSTYTKTFENIGLSASVGNNRYAYIENTPVLNLLLNVKYLVGRDSEQAYSSYLKPVATTDECTLYENTAYVPSGYMISNNIFAVTEGSSDWKNPLSVQADWFGALTGISEPVYVFAEPVSEVTCDKMELVSESKYEHCFEIDLTGVAAPEKTAQKTEDSAASTTETKVSTSDEAGLPMVVEYTIPEDGEYFGYFRSTTVDDGYVTVYSDEADTRKISMKYAYTSALGNLKKGDKIEVVMNAAYGRNTRVGYYLAKLNSDVLMQGVDALRTDTMVLEERTDRGIKGSINVTKGGLFLTSVLYDGGWKAYVDGKEVEITPVENTFVAFALSEGEHTIELEFTAEGAYSGLMISIAGLTTFVLLCIASACKKKNPVQRQVVGIYTDTQTTSETENCTDTEA